MTATIGETTDETPRAYLRKHAIQVLRDAVLDNLNGRAYMRDDGDGSGPCPHGIADVDCTACRRDVLRELLDGPAQYLFNDDEIDAVTAPPCRLCELDSPWHDGPCV